MQHLQPNTTLQGGKYRIERVLGQGGFGITYLARNTVFDVDVAIKEFFMKDENERNGCSVTIPNSTKTELFNGQKEKFKKEAKRMFSIKNEHIIGVHDLFEENGTAYYVMDYVDGENLLERLKRTGKPMAEQEVRELLPQILDALQAVHSMNIWHLDLKPANILLDKSGNIKLIDFGASKQLNKDKGGATFSTAISYTDGYAPREQMEQNYDKFGPWTDIYALGATLYTLLTNKRPPLPTDIDDDMSEDKHLALPFPVVINDNMKALVLKLMKTNRKLRPQECGEILPVLASLSANSPTEGKQEIFNKSSFEYSGETIIGTTRNVETVIDSKESNNKDKYEDASNKTTEVDPIVEYEDEKDYHVARWVCISLCVLFVGFIIYYGTREKDGYGTKDVSYSWGDGKYEGDLKSGQPNGHGVINYYDGSRFEGEFINGVTNGHGKYISSDGKVLFDGNYVNGQRTEGLMTNDDGTQYRGAFENGMPNGQGKLLSANGELLFEGTFAYGQKMNGRGKESGKNNDGETWTYEGEYKNGVANGKGTVTWSNGDQYTGDWKEGTRTGNGTYTFNEKRNGYGYKYVGGFLNGEFHGKGTWYYVGGGSIKCTYKNGKQI